MHVMCLYCYQLKWKEKRWTRLQIFSDDFNIFYFKTFFLRAKQMADCHVGDAKLRSSPRVQTVKKNFPSVEN